MSNETRSNKTGYLNENFNLFHLRDKKQQEFPFHYHEFNKIIIFLSGKVTYLIEGKAYFLKPWDILLVNNHHVHKPIIDSSEPYERIVIWVNSNFIESHNYEACDLSSCFKKSKEKSISLLRLSDDFQKHLKSIIGTLEVSINSNEFGSKLLSNALFIQFLIYLNRLYLGNMGLPINNSLKYDKQIEEIIKYINDNLTIDLSLDTICKNFFISKYYLMHKFKRETGFTLHNYIIQKRLFRACEFIKEGKPIKKAYMECGFTEYSTFLRAFKKQFNILPTELKP